MIKLIKRNKMLTPDNFKYLYKSIRSNLNELIVNLQIFDYDFLFFEPDIKNYMNIDSIMYLSNDINTHFILRNGDIYNNAIEVLSNQMITDDSEIEDINIHIHFYIFTYIIHYYEKDDSVKELLNLLIHIFSYFSIYIESGEEMEMIKMELMFEESL